MCSACDVSIALYSLFTNCAMDSKALLPISGKRWHFLAFVGMSGISRSAVSCVASMDMLLSNLTITPGAHCCMFAQCALMPMKWLVYPEPAIACSLSAKRRAANVYLDVLENTIVFVAKLCLVVIILSRMYHAADTAASVCVVPSFFCRHYFILEFEFLLR